MTLQLLFSPNHCFQANFFDEYQIEGVNQDNNEIYLEVITESIVRSLKSAQTAKSMKIKLTKKDCPCLTFEVELVNTLYSKCFALFEKFYRGLMVMRSCARCFQSFSLKLVDRMIYFIIDCLSTENS